MRKLVEKLKKFVATTVFVFIVVQAGIFATPSTAHAQFAVVATNPDLAALWAQEFLKEEVEQSIYGAVIGGLTTALINITNTYAQNFAHDAALLIASGGNGDKPLFEQRPWYDYFIYAGAEVAAEIVEALNEESVLDGRLDGFSVCAPPNLGSLRVGITSNFKEQDLPICDGLDQLKDNWIGFYETTRNNIVDPKVRNETILNTLSQTIDPNVSEFSVTMSVFTQSLLKADEKRRYSFLELLGKDGVWDVTDFITGQTTTPSDFVVDYYKGQQKRVQDAPFDLVSNIMMNSDALIQVGLNAASVFTNTLLSEMTQKLADGLFPVLDLDADPFNPVASSVSSREAAVEALRSLKSFQPLDVTNYNLLNEMVTCPSTTRGVSRRLYNCVLDTNFATALGRGEGGAPLTLQQAIDEGLINGGWPLIPAEDSAADQDPNCYNYGFCHSNLVKLRKARVIPIGWELATTIPEAAGGNLTVQEVINGFNDCNAENERDDAHPFCHLIDPNWVLKMPESSCRTLAHGQIIDSAGTSTRAEECVDLQSCILEDESGSCVGGFGYCVREKNTWRFRGEECPAEAASCLGFSSSEGESVNVLTTTVDQADCGEENVGCTWYSTGKELNADSEYDWPVITNTETAASDPDAYKDQIFLTNESEDCSESSAGCTKLIERTEGLTLNVLQNGGFEVDANDDEFPDAWLTTDYTSVDYEQSRTDARSGTGAINPGALVYQPGVLMRTGSFYTLSFYAKQSAPATLNSVQVALVTSGLEDGAEANFGFTSFDSDNCTLLDTDSNGISDTISIIATPTGEAYERFECAFTVPTFAGGDEFAQAFLDISGPGFAGIDVWVDDVMLENETTASTWTDNYSENFGSLLATHLKLPPSYLGCTGAVDDPEECSDYARICTENDASCTLYTPTNGDPAVAGIVNELDRCDEECVGYDTYKQEPTLYEPEGEFPVYFIADTADQCGAEAVGCDEFTNLETEELEHFTYLRSCVTEDQAAGTEAVFYTWEGSDVEGYQLRTWDLLESNIVSGASHSYSSGFIESNFGNAPCTVWFADEDGITCSESISDVTLPNPDTCDEHDDIFDNPDCREFYDENGDIHYRNWRDTVTVNNVCVSYRKTEIAGLGDDNDADGTDDGQENCENSGGYFNTDANTCIYYGFDEESDTCSASENGCREYTGGQSGNSRIVLNETFEGDLTDWDASSASNATLSNESIATGGHSLASTASTPILTFLYDEGSTCTDPAGCDSGLGTLGGSCFVLEGEQYCGTLEGELFQGKTYTLTFWAKGDGNIDVGFDILTSGAAPTIDAFFMDDVELESDWNRYSFGPLNMTEDNYPNFGAGTTLAFDPDGASEFFIDNIVLREGESNVTVIRDSWVTPASCDENFEGTVSPQFQLGCMEYTDQAGGDHYLKSFSRLCSEDVIGCKAYFHTSNSENIRGEVRNATCSTVDGLPVGAKTTCFLLQNGGTYDINSPRLCDIVAGESSCQFDLDFNYPADQVGSGPVAHISYAADAEYVLPDRTVFAVFDSQFSCSSNNEGCQELGKPTLSSDHSTVESWESVYQINDPDTYDDTLCHEEDLFCEEWSGSDGSTRYFKHPQGRTCEYKTNVTIAGLQMDGWFRTGTSEFCYGTGVCSGDGATVCSLDSDCADIGLGSCTITSGSFVIGGLTSGIWKNGDTDYDGWVGECDSQNDGCTEFQDPLDFEDDEFYGQTDGEQFYFLDDSSLEESTLLSSEQCDGQVSQRQGCVLFRDTGETGLNYNASSTLISSRHADELFGGEEFDLVDPIDCESGDSTIQLPNGDTVDLCAQRCVYRNSQLDSTYDRATDVTQMTDIFTIDGSCFEAADCAQKEADTGDLVSGRCTTTLTDPLSVFSPESVPRLDNDTNRVLKVNRDRVCSEWLQPDDVRPIWDEGINAFRNISSALLLCQGYVGEGDTTQCADVIINDPAVVLDLDRYTSRDVTWYGDEYAGYAIPETYPLQHLSQVNINIDRECKSAITGEFTGVDCSADDSICGAAGACATKPPDYRLAFDAGECSEAHGGACTVGYCSESGLPCSADSQCLPDGGSCVTGQCYDAITSGVDSQDDCAAGEVFIAGTCYEDVGDCDLAGSCGGVGTCFQSVATTEGSCYRGACVLSVNGETFDADVEETQICRAYPEEDSPFSDSLVNLWTDGDGVVAADADPTDPIGLTPYDTISGFENANFCAPGEDCLCSYRKIASSTGTSSYIDIETVPSSADYVGTCSGGASDGAICEEDVDCGADDDGDGEPDNGATCEPLTNVDSIYGLPGFCLERDTGINIHGDQDLGACVTWLPIDELQGTSDLFAKYLEAGFFEDVMMCTDVRMFADKGISRIEYDGTYVACADKVPDGCGNDADEDAADSADNVDCPDGYFALMGMCPKGGSIADSTSADACVVPTLTGGRDDRNDYPYVCVPEDSYRNGDPDDFCTPPSVGGEIKTSTTSDDGTTVYIHYKDVNGDGTVQAGTYSAFDDLVREYENCWERSEVYDSGFQSGYVDFPTSSNETGNGDHNDYWNLDFPVPSSIRIYPACKEIVEVSTSEESYAWTDRLWSGTSFSGISGPEAYLSYPIDIGPGKYGEVAIDPDAVGEAEPPARVGACIELLTADPWIEPPSQGDGSDCLGPHVAIDWYGDGASDPASGSLEARTFIDFEYVAGEFAGFPASWSDTGWSTRGESTDNVFGRITQLFAWAGVGELWDWNDSTLEYNASVDADGTYPKNDATYDVRGVEGSPPIIAGIDSSNCFGSFCEEAAEGTLTVNSQTSGDFEEEGGFFRTTLEFFAWADPDQLPIRRVIVDWGDGGTTGSTTPDNYYKNHRGLQPGSKTESICDEGTEWGKTAESCDPNHFRYTHNYTCNEAFTLSSSTWPDCTFDGDGNLVESPCKFDGQCAYQMRVHVRDNWGWCTGECTAGAEGDLGCFENDVDSLNELTTTEPDGECVYQTYPSPTIPQNDPWTYYDGVIYVSP